MSLPTTLPGRAAGGPDNSEEMDLFWVKLVTLYHHLRQHALYAWSPRAQSHLAP